MKVIDQYHEITNTSHFDPIGFIGRNARICYKSEDKSTPSSDKKLVEMLVKKGHHSQIEHVYVTVKFITNRGVTHELARHRHINASQESTRYCRYDGDMVFIRPVWFSENLVGDWPDVGAFNYKSYGISDVEFLWLSACDSSADFYQSLLEFGQSPQKARTVLNNALKTEMAITANLREWRHILKLRTSKAAHPQIRALMFNLMADLQQQIPIVFDNIILQSQQ
jgi:thymidylate synthase (FAD)